MSESIRQFVEFKLGDEKYGIDILQVKTIERMMPITRFSALTLLKVN